MGVVLELMFGIESDEQEIFAVRLPVRISDPDDYFFYVDGRLADFKVEESDSASDELTSSLIRLDRDQQFRGRQYRLLLKTVVERQGQLQDYANYSVALINREFNHIYQLIAQLDNRFNYVLRFSDADHTRHDPLDARPSVRANKIISFNEAGDVFLRRFNDLSSSRHQGDQGSAPGFSLRAWVIADTTEFSGNLMRVLNRRNVAFLQRDGLGEYSVYYTSPMAQDDYMVIVSTQNATVHQIKETTKDYCTISLQSP